MDSRSRLPSISHLQEKLKRRWPRTLRITSSGVGGAGGGGGGGGGGGVGGGGGGGGEGRERSAKYWKTAPRLVSIFVYYKQSCRTRV